jgi:hypothetical protein
MFWPSVANNSKVVDLLSVIDKYTSLNNSIGSIIAVIFFIAKSSMLKISGEGYYL